MSDKQASPARQDTLDDFARLTVEQQRVLCDIARRLDSIRYGSILLTIHDGRLVEFTETVRHRTRNSGEQNR